MEKVIHEYYLKPLLGRQVIMVPEGSEILTVQNQDDNLVVWVLKPLIGEDVKKIWIETFFTGGTIGFYTELKRKYISTVQIKGLVFHLFETIEE